MTSGPIPAAAAGTWKLGDLTVNRVGFGAMRLTGSAPFHHGTPSDRKRSVSVLRRAVELGVNHIDTAAFYFSQLRSALFGALAELREAGLIRHLGVSGVTVGQIAQAQAIAPVVCVQNRYGIGQREASDDDVAAAWDERGIAIPGTGDPVHLAENVAGALRLSPDDRARLNSIDQRPQP